MNVDLIFKIVVLGDSGVGKTSFVHYLHDNTPCQKGSTIGVDFAVYTTIIDDKRIKAQIWDTAGQEQFRSITKSYFRNVAGALVFYDVTNIQSYNNVKSWINDLIAHGVHENTIMCIANKIDLSHSHHIPEFYYENNFKILQNTIKYPSQNVFDIFLTHIYKLYINNHIRIGIKNTHINPQVILHESKSSSYKYCSC